MSHISLWTSSSNPVTSSHVVESLKRTSRDLAIKSTELPDYTAILAGAHEVFEKISQLDDYIPDVDRERYPRTNVHFPTQKDNAHNAWAWKANVVGAAAEGPLKGKTVCLKGKQSAKPNH